MENITDSLKNIKSGMVVTAHPDDAEYGCSGTVAKLANNGSDMVYVLCTDGSKGTEDKNLSPEKLAKIRNTCLLYTSPSPRDGLLSRMPSSA